MPWLLEKNYFNKQDEIGSPKYHEMKVQAKIWVL